MKVELLTEADQELIAAAVETSNHLYLRGWHEVAASVRTKAGVVFCAIHFDTPGGVSVCGEVAAVCSMVARGHRDLETICAVWRNEEGQHFLLPPCGRCREVIRAFNPEAWVIVTTPGEHWLPLAIDKAVKVRIGTLLPLPWR